MILLYFFISMSPLSDSLFSYLEQIDYFSAKYEETVLDTMTETSYLFKGTIYLARPNYFRMNVDYPEKQLLICDGQVLWLYLYEDSTTYQIDLNDPQADIPRPDKFIFGSSQEYQELNVTRNSNNAVLSYKPVTSNRFFNKIDVSVTVPIISINYLRIYSDEFGERLLRFIPESESFDPLPDSLFYYNFN